MSHNADLCEWSDLPRRTCDHCPPQPPPTTDERRHALLELLAEPAPSEPSPPAVDPLRPRLDRHDDDDLRPTYTVRPAKDRRTLVDYVRELTEPTTHREPVTVEKRHPNGSTTTYTEDHIIAATPLIEQLWDSLEPSGQGGEVGATHPGSKPAASLDAIAAAAKIDIDVNRWITDLGEDAPLPTGDAIRRLHGLSAGVHRCKRAAGRKGLDCCTYHLIEVAVRSWWVMARVLTGWDSPTWKPNATCPLCGQRQTIAIRESVKLATCTACHEAWDESNINLLAEHIRLEADQGPTPRAMEPCRCAFPRDVMVGRIVVCPDCGSRYCVKAQDQRVAKLTRHDTWRTG